MITKEAIEAGARGVMIDKFVYERNRAEAAEAAEARIAELEKRLADAEKIVARVPPYLTDMYKAICRGDETAAAGFAGKDELVRAARALTEKLEREIGNA